MTKKYLVSVVENICSGPGAARSVKRLQVCSPCSALAPNLGPAVGCWRLVTATIQPPEPEPERERAIVTVITNAGNIKCIIFTQLVILDHLWFWPWFINRLSQLLNWRNMYGMVWCEIGSIYVWIYASFICAISLPPITFALKMFRLFNTNIQSINYFYIGCKSAWDCHSCNWSPDSANFSHHDLTHPQPHYYFAFIFFYPFEIFFKKWWYISSALRRCDLVSSAICAGRGHSGV